MTTILCVSVVHKYNNVHNHTPANTLLLNQFKWLPPFCSKSRAKISVSRGSATLRYHIRTIVDITATCCGFALFMVLFTRKMDSRKCLCAIQLVVLILISVHLSEIDGKYSTYYCARQTRLNDIILSRRCDRDRIVLIVFCRTSVLHMRFSRRP